MESLSSVRFHFIIVSPFRTSRFFFLIVLHFFGPVFFSFMRHGQQESPAAAAGGGQWQRAGHVKWNDAGFFSFKSYIFFYFVWVLFTIILCCFSIRARERKKRSSWVRKQHLWRSIFKRFSRVLNIKSAHTRARQTGPKSFTNVEIIKRTI